MQHVSRRFGAIRAVDDISLDFPAGSFTALLGPSGCGKSTLLRLIAGFEAPDAGDIHFGDRLVSDPGRQVPPEERGVGIVFQSYALWPHMDVAGNVAYPLKTRGADRRTIDAKVADVLGMVGLDGFGARKVDELSGGQRQRVALARCLVADAGIILFDEPLANLDMHLRASMVDVFRDIHRRIGATIVYVTHDQAEALALADRVAVLDRGRLLQVAPPQEVYRSPSRREGSGFRRARDPRLGACRPGCRWQGRRGDRRTSDRGAQHGQGRRRVAFACCCGRSRWRWVRPAFPRSSLRPPIAGRCTSCRLRLETGEELVLDHPRAPAIGDRVSVAVSDAWIIPED